MVTAENFGVTMDLLQLFGIPETTVLLDPFSMLPSGNFFSNALKLFFRFRCGTV